MQKTKKLGLLGKLLTAGAAVVSGFGLADRVNAANIYLEPKNNVTQNQAIINSANAGDTVIFKSGTYDVGEEPGSYTLKKGITYTGENRDTTILRGIQKNIDKNELKGTAIYIQGSNTTLENLTIENVLEGLNIGQEIYTNINVKNLVIKDTKMPVTWNNYKSLEYDQDSVNCNFNNLLLIHGDTAFHKWGLDENNDWDYSSPKISASNITADGFSTLLFDLPIFDSEVLYGTLTDITNINGTASFTEAVKTLFHSPTNGREFNINPKYTYTNLDDNWKQLTSLDSAFYPGTHNPLPGGALYTASGELMAFDPTLPEPATLGILVLGLPLLFLRKRN